jgi:hypothetical protein
MQRMGYVAVRGLWQRRRRGHGWVHRKTVRAGA